MMICCFLGTSAIYRLLPRKSFSHQIKVLVGPEKREFDVNKELICSASEVFDQTCRYAQLAGTSVNRGYTLKDFQPETFSIFLAWLLTKDISSAEEFLPYPDEEEDEDENEILERPQEVVKKASAKKS
jgi:hypothetical protein